MVREGEGMLTAALEFHSKLANGACPPLRAASSAEGAGSAGCWRPQKDGPTGCGT